MKETEQNPEIQDQAMNEEQSEIDSGCPICGADQCLHLLEAEAKKKFCPLIGSFCLTGGCMAWLPTEGVCRFVRGKVSSRKG